MSARAKKVRTVYRVRSAETRNAARNIKGAAEDAARVVARILQSLRPPGDEW